MLRRSFPIPPASQPSPATAEAARIDRVSLGLGWFKGRQSRVGSWHDPVTTGIVLLAFLGRGETHQTGSSRETVKNGLKYLRDVQDADGCLAPRDSPNKLRDHAVAGLALVEAYGMTSSVVFKEAAQRAVAFALKTRTPSSGWSRPDGRLDFEATVWMSMLVKSAKLSELDVDTSVLADAVTALDQVTDHATGRVNSLDRSLPDETATAIGMIVRRLAGHAPKDDEMIRKGAELLAAKPPSWAAGETPDHRYQYFGTFAMNEMRNDVWVPWLHSLIATVNAGQATEENSETRGTWSSAGASTSEGDRIWSTAFTLLCVETYAYRGYRHATEAR